MFKVVLFCSCDSDCVDNFLRYLMRSLRRLTCRFEDLASIVVVEGSLKTAWPVGVSLLATFSGGASGDDFSPLPSTFWTDVNDPVGCFDDVHVVFDDYDRVASVDKFVKDFKKVFDVMEVEACGGFVEDVERFACRWADEFFCQFDALRFAT